MDWGMAQVAEPEQTHTKSKMALYFAFHSTSPVLWWVFLRYGLMSYLPRLVSTWSSWSLPSKLQVLATSWRKTFLKKKKKKKCFNQIPFSSCKFHGNIFSCMSNIVAIFRYGVWAPFKQLVQVCTIIGRRTILELGPCGKCEVRSSKARIQELGM
jgi:hypothetical protein